MFIFKYDIVHIKMKGKDIKNAVMNFLIETNKRFKWPMAYEAMKNHVWSMLHVVLTVEFPASSFREGSAGGSLLSA